MRYLLLLPIVYIAAVTETSLVDLIGVGPVTPDLLAMVAIVWLMLVPTPRAILVAGAIVLVGDLIAPGRPGVGMAWMLLVGYAITRLRQHVKMDHLAVQLIVLWAAVTLWASAVAITSQLTGHTTSPWPTLLANTTGVGIYTAGVSLPALMIIGWIREPRRTRQARMTGV
jgi:cell shape-determining protein MreD